MNIIDYFDPYSIAHIRAWQYLSQHGHWSEGFQTTLDADGVTEFPIAWQVALAAKCGDAWVDQMDVAYEGIDGC